MLTKFIIMKKIFFFISLLLFIFTYISCVDENEKDLLNIENYQNDKRVEELFLLSKDLTKIPEKGKEFSSKFGKMYLLYKNISDDYGYDNILSESQRLVLNDISFSFKSGGGCCERNEDGTKNWDCCSFWEHVVVLIHSIGCPEPDGLHDQETEEQEAEQFYDCIQQTICEDY